MKHKLYILDYRPELTFKIKFPINVIVSTTLPIPQAAAAIGCPSYAEGIFSRLRQRGMRIAQGDQILIPQKRMEAQSNTIISISDSF